MNKKITDKDKKAWQEFVNSKEKLHDKDQQFSKKILFNSEKTIDLHGFNLNEANIEIEKFVLTCFKFEPYPEIKTQVFLFTIL